MITVTVIGSPEKVKYRLKGKLAECNIDIEIDEATADHLTRGLEIAQAVTKLAREKQVEDGIAVKIDPNGLCHHGDCHFDNFNCPNGCPDVVDLY